MEENKKLPISKRSILIASTLVLAIGLPIAYLLWSNAQEDAGAWYNSSWLYRRSLSVGNSGTELTNEDVLIEYDTAALVTAGKLQSDCDDLRFVDSDDSTALAYWVEGGCNTSTTHIWVRVPTLPSGGKTIYMYYGNGSATNAEETWTGKFYLIKNSSCDAGWTTESSSGGDFFSKFPFGSSSYGNTGGSARHTHSNTTLQTNTTAVSQNVNSNSGLNTSLNHYHNITITMNSPSSDILPPYLDMIFCSNTDLIIKDNQVALFTTSVPSGFTRFSALDSKLPRGNSTYGASSSTTTHTHTLNGNITTAGPSATGTCASGSTQVPTSTHTHTSTSPTAGNGTMMPEYLTMIYGQADTDTMAPSGTITMSNAIPPLGWNRFSTLDSKFPYGSSSYGTTGGSTTHTHSVSATTGNESATVGCATTTPTTTRVLTHTHTVSGNLNSASNNPPYIETLFIQKKSSQNVTVNNEQTENQTPTAPTTLLTEGATNPSGVTDITPEFSAIFNDPDTAETAIYYRIQVNTASDFNGTSMWDSTKKSVSPITKGSRSPDISYNGTTLSANGVTYYWRIKFWDDRDSESPWSATALFTMSASNLEPNPPGSPYTEGTSNPIKVIDTTPEFSAIFTDPDAANTGIHYEIEVNSNNTFTGTVLWDTGQTAITAITNGYRSSDISYAGTTLTLNGATYYWRIRFWDNNGLVSNWSLINQFTMSGTPSVPSSLYTEGSTNPSGVTDQTPEFSAIHTDPNDDSTAYYEIEVNTNSGFTGTVMWDSGQTALTVLNNTRSSDISYNGTTLPLNGTTYYWRIRFWDIDSNVSNWSSTAQFTMATSNTPYPPSSLYTEGTTNPTKVTDLTPEFSAIFTDPNGTDSGTHYEIEVNTNNSFTGTVMWDSGQQSITAITNGARSSDIPYNGSTLSLTGNTYYWRIRFWDNGGVVSNWSLVNQFTMSGPPNTPTNLNVDGMTNPSFIHSTTPKFSAYHTDSNGDSAIYYEIEVNSDSSFTETVMWDTGKTSMTSTTSGQYSPQITYSGIALTGTSNLTYHWRIRFWDTDDNVSEWSDVGSFVDFLQTEQFIQMNGVGLEGIKIN